MKNEKMISVGKKTYILPEWWATKLGAYKLTNRELEILYYWFEKEFSNFQIADLLFISTKTVEKHKSNIHQKIGTKNSVGLIKLLVSKTNEPMQNKLLFSQRFSDGIEVILMKL